MITFESAVNRLAERVSDVSQESRNIRLQRRNQVVDIYGMEFTRQGDIEKPASFYISISPDLIYFERFEFKVIIESFRVPIAEDSEDDENGVSVRGISPEIVIVKERSIDLDLEMVELTSDPITLNLGEEDISVTDEVVSPNPHGHRITPNPHRHTIPEHSHTINSNSHDHETEPHSHTIRAGMTYETVSATQFSIWIWIDDDGEIAPVPRLIEQRASRSGEPQLRVNMSPYFQALLSTESRSRWIVGEGIFPSPGLKNFDVLEAVAYMTPELREKILKPGYKRIDIEGDGVFNATLVNYLKYSHVNR